MAAISPTAARLSPREILQQYRLPRTLEEANAYLSRLQLSLHLLGLYQRYFPQAYARSTARPLPLDHEAYSPREAEFLLLVDTGLFPIYVDFLMYVAAAEERSTVIPARPLGRTSWDEDLGDLPGAWRLAFFIAGEIRAEDLATYEPDLTPAEESPLLTLQWGSVAWQAFDHDWQGVVQATHPALAAVPLALELVAHDTGNAFLDPTDEMPLDNFFWTSDEDVQILVEHYQQATTMIEQIEGLLAWLRQEPSRLDTLLELMRACIHVQPAAQRGSARRDALDEDDELELDEEERDDDDWNEDN